MGRGKRTTEPTPTIARPSSGIHPVAAFDMEGVVVSDERRSRRYEADPGAVTIRWDEHSTTFRGDRFAVEAVVPHWAAGPVGDALRDLGTPGHPMHWETPVAERALGRWWHSVEVHPTGLVTLASHIRRRGEAALGRKHPISIPPAARQQLAHDLMRIATGHAHGDRLNDLRRLDAPTGRASMTERLFGERA